MYDVIAHMSLQQDLTDVPGTCLTGFGANLVIGRRVAQTTKIIQSGNTRCPRTYKNKWTQRFRPKYNLNKSSPYQV